MKHFLFTALLIALSPALAAEQRPSCKVLETLCVIKPARYCAAYGSTNAEEAQKAVQQYNTYCTDEAKRKRAVAVAIAVSNVLILGDSNEID